MDTEKTYVRKPVTKLSGDEHFSNHTTRPFTVLDFWEYGFSNLNSNVLRGSLAEFLVECALKELTEIEIRNPWGDYDVEYKSKKIEVKSCSYLQDWDQPKLSIIRWAGLKAKSLYWSSAVGDFNKDEQKEYKSDIYVLALLNHTETETLDILNLDQWCFYVLSKEILKTISKDKSAISLLTLQKHDIKPVTFDHLKNVIDSLFG
ncbi:MAG: hypothetical protein HQ488_02840 [Parcubacteria group bacterium]|nr:hypothetical protein [Parcubacteria group bacterium]